MSICDPIADLLTRIRNALSAGHERVDVPASRIKLEICRVLEHEGFLEGYKVVEAGSQKVIQVGLKYTPERKPVIQELRRVSKQSLRQYAKSKDIKLVRGGLGIAVVSTSQGVMTGKEARRAKIGGEVLCEVW